MTLKKPVPGGFLIAIEGIDGAGKSVAIEGVARSLRLRGLEVVLTREPTCGPWGRKLRDSMVKGRMTPEDELEAFMEDRKEHVRTLIAPNLAANRIVITDRYYFSTVAYQGARGYDPLKLMRENEAFAVEPHLLVVVDVDPETSLARIGYRDGLGNHFETRQQLVRSRQIFLELQKPYLVVVDGRQRPCDVRDEILLAFHRFALQRISEHREWMPSERLKAVAELLGAPGFDA